MRLWSIHPGYLDSKGLVALWRESLLAQSVLSGKTKGYRNHPQLDRFKSIDDPLAAIASYLLYLADEADRRNYKFNREKIGSRIIDYKISVSVGQLEYEFNHLLTKLKIRNFALYEKFKTVKEIIPHPLFREIDGGIEKWEVVH